MHVIRTYNTYLKSFDFLVGDDGTDYRKLFSDWWRSTWNSVKFPSRENVFDYFLSNDSNSFDSWVKSPFFYSVDFDGQQSSMNEVTVPTSETCSVAFWMNMLVGMSKPVMLAGPAGTGKTQQKVYKHLIICLNKKFFNLMKKLGQI